MSLLPCSKKILLCMVSCFMLAACGEGWTVVKVTDYFPYGHMEGTAGSGVMYVRAKMLPELDMNLDMHTQDIASPLSETPMLGADDLFKKVLRK